MNVNVAGLAHDLQILNRIVSFISVLVMNDLGAQEQSSDVLLHHNSISVDITETVRRWVIWTVEVNPTTSVCGGATFPVRVPASSPGF